MRFSFFFLSLISGILNAQDLEVPVAFEGKTGILTGNEDAYLSTASPFMAGAAPVAPADKSWDLFKYLDGAGYQGTSHTCVAWALAHMKTIQDHVQNKWNGVYSNGTQVDGSRKVSPYYIYDMVRRRLNDNARNCDVDIDVRAALMMLSSVGAISTKSLPIDNSNCRKPIDGVPHSRISGYFLINKQDYSTEQLIDLIKVKLKENVPILILTNYYKSLHDKGFSPQLDKNQPLICDNSFNGPCSSHAMVIVGYDNDKSAFHIVNSYGKNWGNQGCFWLDYAAINKVVNFLFYTKNMTLDENALAEKFYNADGTINKDALKYGAGSAPDVSGDDELIAQIDNTDILKDKNGSKVLDRVKDLHDEPIKVRNKDKRIYGKYVWGFDVREGNYIPQNKYLNVNCMYVSAKEYKVNFTITTSNGEDICHLSFDENNRALSFKYNGKTYTIILQAILLGKVARYGMYSTGA